MPSKTCKYFKNRIKQKKINMKTIISNLFICIGNRIERFGYPIVMLTGPKNGINFKVDLSDPNFDKPLSEVKIQL